MQLRELYEYFSLHYRIDYKDLVNSLLISENFICEETRL